MRLPPRLATYLIFVCTVFTDPAAFAQNRALVADPVRAELVAMGKPGLTIELARENVIEILQSENSCSAWFKKADPDVAATFASLRFLIYPNGPRYITAWRSGSGDLILMHPYVASVLENSGRGSVVMLNAKGAFFVRSTLVFLRENNGGFLRPIYSRILDVGFYAGDTLPAQMTTLLHELGHVIGRLPDDSDESSGQSGRNTAEVLRYCRSEIKAAERRSHH